MFPLRIYVNVMLFLNLWPIASNTQDARTLKAAVEKTGKILGSASFQSWKRLPPWVMEEVEVAPTGGAFIVEGEHDRSAVPSSGSDHFWKRNYCNLMISQWFLLFNFGPFEFIWCVSRLRWKGEEWTAAVARGSGRGHGSPQSGQPEHAAGRRMKQDAEWCKQMQTCVYCILQCSSIFIIEL